MGCCGVVGDGVGQMVSGGHVAIGGGLTPLLAQALQYFSAWPLAPLDGNTSMALAGLIVAGVGGGGVAWVKRGPGEGSVVWAPTDTKKSVIAGGVLKNRG